MFENFTFDPLVNPASTNNETEELEHLSPKDTSAIMEQPSTPTSMPEPTPVQKTPTNNPPSTECPTRTPTMDALAGELSKQYIRGWDTDIILTPDPELDMSLDEKTQTETTSTPPQQRPASPARPISPDDLKAAIAAESSSEPKPQSSDITLLDCYVAYRHSRAGHMPASQALTLASSGIRKNCGGLPLRFRHARDVANSSPNLVRNRPRMRKREGMKTSSKSGSAAGSVAGESEGSVASFELMCES